MGDSHGSAKGIKQVLERCDFDPLYDKLIHLGDVSDGWPETSESVDILIDIKRTANLSSIRNDADPVFIRGNHDVWVHDWFMYGHRPIIWTQQGGQATIDSYLESGKLQDKDHRLFWFNQSDWYVDDKNRLFIHGGWDYLYPWPVGAVQAVNAGSIAKECHWNRSLLESAKAAFSPNFKGTGRFKALEQFEEIYIGHTAIPGKNPEPRNYGNLWNVDTGAGWNGVLTVIDIDTKEFWQSDPSKTLYPDARGRR